MYAILKGNYAGELIWAATHETEAEAIEEANETMLREEETVMVVQVAAFRQQITG